MIVKASAKNAHVNVGLFVCVSVHRPIPTSPKEIHEHVHVQSEFMQDQYSWKKQQKRGKK